MDRNAIVVCGATGNQGGAVVQSLLSTQAWKVIALSRDPEGERARELAQKGVEVRKADLEDRQSLILAFDQAYGVFGVTQPWSPDYKKCDPEAEVRQGRNIVDACAKTGARHLVYSSAYSRVFLSDNGRTGAPHADSKLQIEDYARASSVPYTFLKPVMFMDFIGSQFFPIKRGSVRGLADGDARLMYICVKDIGAFAALAFARPQEYIGEELDLIGDFVSGEDLCQILSRLRNGERFKYKAAPRLLLRIFAREFYLMRVGFEKVGRPQYPKEILEAMTDCKRRYPGITSVEQYLESVGYNARSL